MGSTVNLNISNSRLPGSSSDNAMDEGHCPNSLAAPSQVAPLLSSRSPHAPAWSFVVGCVSSATLGILTALSVAGLFSNPIGWAVAGAGVLLGFIGGRADLGVMLASVTGSFVGGLALGGIAVASVHSFLVRCITCFTVICAAMLIPALRFGGGRLFPA